MKLHSLNVVAVLTLLASCASSGPATSNDAATNDAATDDASPSADSGADGASPIALPGCLRELLAACPLDGTCRGYEFEPGMSCYASGVVTNSTVASLTPYELSSIVKKSDGSPCYTLLSRPSTDSGGPTVSWTWRNPAGDRVGEGTKSSRGSYTFTCAATGETTGPIDCATPPGCTLPTRLQPGAGCVSTPCP